MFDVARSLKEVVALIILLAVRVGRATFAVASWSPSLLPLLYPLFTVVSLVGF